jgi:general secretion pathway protein D
VLLAPQEGEKPIFKEEVRIVADETTNSLVILATPRDYAMIRDVLRKLDIVPRQVLIEAMIAEVQLVGDLAFGLEYAISQGGLASLLGTSTAEDGTTTSGSGVAAGDLGSAGSLSIANDALLGASKRAVNIGAQGLFGFLTDRDNFLVMISALASKDRVNILATPHVMAADNREARILIGEEVPILTSSATSSITDSARTVNSVQYRDTGRILTILPQVSSAGLVNLEIRQEVSAVGQEDFGRTNSPSFVSRETETTVVVQDGESVVLGGIIDDQSRRTRSGVPFLMDIPVLGRLFRVDSERMERTELIILITPHVIRNRQELRAVTEKFSGRIRSLKEMVDAHIRRGRKAGAVPPAPPHSPAAITTP